MQIRLTAFLFTLFVRIFVALKGGVGDVVEPEDWLVGVLDNEVLAILLHHDQVDDTPNDAPAVVQVNVDLVGKVLRLELLRAQDDVARRVPDLEPRDVTELDQVGSDQE